VDIVATTSARVSAPKINLDPLPRIDSNAETAIGANPTSASFSFVLYRADKVADAAPLLRKQTWLLRHFSRFTILLIRSSKIMKLFHV